MRIRWIVPAADDLESIKNYLQQHYSQFAEPTVRTIYQRIRSLKTHPNRLVNQHKKEPRQTRYGFGLSRFDRLRSSKTEITRSRSART